MDFRKCPRCGNFFHSEAEVCENCKNVNSIIEDYINGIIVCTTCGLVYEENVVADEYEKTPFHILSLEEYTNIICHCIEIIDKNIVIHRITGDGDKKILIAPLWSGDKKRVLNTINTALRQRNIIQGSKSDKLC